MAEQQELIHNICSYPLNMDLRKIYTNWLMDHGQTQLAEFILDQLESTQLVFTRKTTKGWKEYEPKKPVEKPVREAIAQLIAPVEAASPIPMGTMLFIQDGFPKNVMMKVRQFVGGECAHCYGSGMSPAEYHGVTDNDGGCWYCQGLGRNSLIKRMFTQWPIQHVDFTDVSEHLNRPINYYQSIIGMRFDTDSIKPLDRFLPVWHSQGPNHYTTFGEAIQALGHAAVAYGRHIAKLDEPRIQHTMLVILEPQGTQ